MCVCMQCCTCTCHAAGASHARFSAATFLQSHYQKGQNTRSAAVHLSCLAAGGKNCPWIKRPPYGVHFMLYLMLSANGLVFSVVFLSDNAYGFSIYCLLVAQHTLTQTSKHPSTHVNAAHACTKTRTLHVLSSPNRRRPTCVFVCLRFCVNIESNFTLLINADITDGGFGGTRMCRPRLA